ncbi:MAG TPA: PAS domain S-box protein [Acidobacteriaceae bacterium]|nr:PAS domain S-box protein [Acidobacteriaceae bacterium]
MRLAAIVDSSDDAILSKDLNGIITSWNAAATRLFGYTSEEVIGQSILMLIPEELQHEEPGILARLSAGERIQHYETRRRCKDGHLVDLSLTISPIRDISGRVIGISKIARDITGRKQAEAALFESERMAAVGRMAASIAHEVNNPLEAVLNLGYLISESPSLDAETRKYVNLLVSEVLRVSEITKQTLSFYRDTSRTAMVNLADLLDSVVRLQRPLLQQKSIQVFSRYQSGVCVMARPGELRQIFTNLIVNSIDAMPSGGEVHISVSRVDNASIACVTVADNGPGIPATVQEHIFEPFFSTKTGKGTGLGLWISQGIVRKYGGSIRVRSWFDPVRRTGTAFRVCLPARS